MKNQWRYSHTETTKAEPAAIWQRWTNVAGWPKEDQNLEKAELVGEFKVGNTIAIKPKGSPKSRVVITEVTPNQSFATQGSIPLGKLIVAHKVEKGGAQTNFTHTITVTGPLRKLFVKMVVQKLANDLPQKMQNIARLAEEL